MRHATLSGNGAGGAGGAAPAAGNADGQAGLPGTPGSGASANLASTSLDTILRTIFAAGGCDTTSFPLYDPLNIAFQAPSCIGAARDPRLAPPADNGGPVPTIRLLEGSGAIDAIGAALGCPATDARGAIRPFGGGCDTGAYEVAPPVAATGAADAVTGGSARVAGSITTRGVPTPFRIDFGATSAYGRQSETARAAGGTTPSAVSVALSGLTPLTTYHYRVVALGADGTSTGDDRTFTTGAAAVAGGPGAPRVTGLTIRPRSFAVVPRGGALRARSRGRVARGAVVRFRLSQAARVTLVVERNVAGRRIRLPRGGPGCVAARSGRSIAAKARCTLHPSAGSLRRSGVAGPNRVVFRARLGRKARALSPGTYRLVAIATDDAGLRSRQVRVPFTIVAP